MNQYASPLKTLTKPEVMKKLLEWAKVQNVVNPELTKNENSNLVDSVKIEYIDVMRGIGI